MAQRRQHPQQQLPLPQAGTGTLPFVALVGRPNVGKSTLFNRLTRSREALVANQPGLTRDRQYGIAEVEERLVTLIDTGGLSEDAKDGVYELMAQQVSQALDEASLVLFLVDARAGITAYDHELASQLRTRGRNVVLVANKVDGVDQNGRAAECYELGLGEPHYISASHGRGVAQLCEAIVAELPLPPEPVTAPAGPACAQGADDADADVVVGVIAETNDAHGGAVDDQATAIAIVGRPNVGKSTLVNRLLGEDRVIVFDEPGTTRDSIAIALTLDDEPYVIIDTAGVRRRGRVTETVEKFSVIKSLDAIARAQVVMLVIDASEGLVDQDLHLLGYALDSGRSAMLVVNKWDGLEPSQRERVKVELSRRLTFAPWLSQQFISALHGTGVGLLLPKAREMLLDGRIRFSANELTKVLEDAVASHPPPSVNGRQIKLRYAHAGGHSPPVVVVHGNQTKSVPDPYRKYLENVFRKALGIGNSPIKVEFRGGENPFAGRRNKLTERQQQRRQRMVRHVKKTAKKKKK